MGRLNWGNQNDGFTFVAPVDSYGARGRNGFGLADIQGNVAEWCLDVSDPRQAHEDLWTGSNTSDRVIRGASFISNLTHNWRSARRLFYPLDISRAFLGFRLVVGVDVTGGSSVASLPASVPKEAGILAPPETRVTTLTTNPKVGEVYTLPLGSNVTMELMGIPPGEFLLGSTKEEQEWANSDKRIKDVECEGEAPRKAAIKQGFWMARTEVTVGQWKQFIKETGYVTDAEKKGESLVPQVGGGSWVVKKGVSWRDPDFGVQAQDNHPVCCISWNDAMAFCEWLEAQEKRSGRLPANCSLRLPTEAEWEYACRAGTQTKFWWGESQRDGAGRLNLTGETDGGRFVTPVDNFGARGRNGFGLADMLGNVYEWCLDGGDPTRAHEDLWTGNSSGRALRGGSFRNPLNTNRCAHRHRVTADYSASCAGFRVMLGRALTGTKTMAPSASVTPTAKEAGILAPPETRVAALTTNPKVGEVYTLPLGSNVTMELMGIPPGEFMLGSTKEERTWAVQNGASADYLKPEGMQPRKARIKQAFWLGRTEVTVGQWKQFVAATRYQTDAERKGYVDGAPQKGQGWNRADGSSWRDPGFGSPQQDNHPVCCVSWNDAVAFCEWLTEQERKAGRLLATQVVRLPTEVEWEYACRAGTQTKFWWGESKEDGNGRLNWKGPEDGFEFVAPVDAFGSQGRNGFGLADMLGNMLEWCLDGYDETQAHEKLWIDNTGQRVLRCGGFRNDPAYCRCAYRFGRYPSRSAGDFGFRVAVAPVQ
jgi:formylglycine-generating enzyme required for sulfatase activity